MANLISATSQSSVPVLKAQVPPAKAPAKPAPPAVAKSPVLAAPIKTPAPAKAAAPAPAVKPNAVATPKAPDLYDKTGVAGAVKKTADATSANGFIADGGDVVVDIKNSDSGYNNKIYWSTDNFKTRNYIGIDNQTGTVNLGKIAKGTRIDFGIDNGQNQFFRTGGAAANFDGVDHTQLTQTSEGTRIGFEDLAGGGDRDFNDAIINVRNLPATAVKSGPVAPPLSNNRSGLGDGTNPGVGTGTANSPNQGTLNPAASKTTAAPAPTVAAKPAAAVKPAAPTPSPKAAVPAPKAAVAAPAIKAAAAAPATIKSASAQLAATTQNMLATLNKTYGTAAGNGATAQKLLGSA